MSRPRFLLDANVLIAVLQGQAHSERARLEALEPGEAVTSTIVEAEVLVGVERSGAAVNALAKRLFERIEPLPFDHHAALAYAALPLRRARFDRLIAAHALSLGLVVVTRNTRDFADVEGLRAESWA